eukprot:933597-Prorocentrum_lima.AAC.1
MPCRRQLTNLDHGRQFARAPLKRDDTSDAERVEDPCHFRRNDRGEPANNLRSEEVPAPCLARS